MNPFRNIMWLSVGDFVAKTLYFVSFVYLARTLGVAAYGVLEFAISILTYMLLLGDGGLELWATRESARGKDTRLLIAQIVPLRFLMATLTFVGLLVLLPFFPDYPGLKIILVLFGLTLFAQAASLKWVFMGREQMTRVAAGLIVAQIVFAVAVFSFVTSPVGLVWVPVLRLVGDLAMAIYFWRLFTATYGKVQVSYNLRNAGNIFRPALTMGASSGLGLLSYNFDTVLLGFLLGPTAVGWYNAAYKPITTMLAIPLTYFQGVFPVLARTYAESEESFREIVVRSMRMMLIFGVPIGMGGTFLAEPVINFLFGPDYANSVLPLQILAWSASLVIIRGTYRQALNAAGRQDIDLRCAGAATFLNVSLNLLLIPGYGILGAATATLLSEVLWLSLAAFYFYRHVTPLNLLRLFPQPVMAMIAMGISLALIQSVFWIVQGVIGGLVYFGMLLLLGEKETWSWIRVHKLHVS